MNISKDELIAVLSQFNPWWRDEKVSDLPKWRRAAFAELFTWIFNPPAPRAVLLSGARQVGKTTLLLHAITQLQEQGVPAANILYATFDHPIIKLAGITAILEAWREREPRVEGQEYLFLDEAQFIREWGTWVKHQVDFNKDRRIIFTGSAMPLLHNEQESGVGRWHTIQLTTLSFYEYLQLKRSKAIKNTSLQILNKSKASWNKIKIGTSNFEEFLSTMIDNELSELSEHFPKPLPQLKSLNDLFEWPAEKFAKIPEVSENYVGHFHEFLVRGGFPQTAQIESVNQAQRLLREDIIDKALKRDMTALFGVRRVLELEHTFLYLCMHDGGILDMQHLCANLEVGRTTVQHFIELLEAAHLIYRLPPYGYGKEILRAKYKIYLADAAIAPAVLLKGKDILENPEALGVATETAVFKHLFSLFYSQNVRFTYWQSKNKQEVDLLAELNGQLIPFEVKYRSQHTSAREFKGLQELCKIKSIKKGYIITKSLKDFGLLNLPGVDTKIMRIPAPLFCYWTGELELVQSEDGFK